MDIRIDPISFLRFLLDGRYTIQQLCRVVDDCFKDWFRREKADAWKFEEYVRHHYAKPLLSAIRRAASDPNAETDQTVRELTEFFAAVQMPFEALLRFNENPVPFASWKPGDIVAVCVARRAARNDEGEAAEANWRRYVHGSRDVLAINDLTNALQRKLHLDFMLRIEPVDPVLRAPDVKKARNKARRQFGRLLADPRVGAIVSLGSGPHNPISNLMAERIADDFDPFPVAFRWTSSERSEIDFLDEKARAASWISEGRRLRETAKAGIWFKTKGHVEFLPRVTDTEIVETASGQNRKRRIFVDSGVLAIDTRRKPVLILAAGHGGSGTRACAMALGKTATIERYMGRPGNEDSNFHSAPDRFVRVVKVERRKQSNNRVDDVALEGWDFSLHE